MAQYRPETFEVLAHTETVKKLVQRLGYPEVRVRHSLGRLSNTHFCDGHCCLSPPGHLMMYPRMVRLRCCMIGSSIGGTWYGG
jgi:hypothetical protein